MVAVTDYRDRHERASVIEQAFEPFFTTKPAAPARASA